MSTTNVLKNKISRLKKQISDTDEKISKLQEIRKDYERQVKELQDDVIMSIVRDSNLSVDEIADAISFGRLMKESGTSKDDVTDLLGIPDKSDKQSAAKEQTTADTDTNLELNAILGGFSSNEL